VAQGTRWVGLDAARVSALVAVEASNDGLVKGEAAGRFPIVMGLDQHRAQITAEWIHLSSGEISRGRVAPADRASGSRVIRGTTRLHDVLPAQRDMCGAGAPDSY
jgi:hypothetical protein